MYIHIQTIHSVDLAQVVTNLPSTKLKENQWHWLYSSLNLRSRLAVEIFSIPITDNTSVPKELGSCPKGIINVLASDKAEIISCLWLSSFCVPVRLFYCHDYWLNEAQWFIFKRNILRDTNYAVQGPGWHIA